MPVAVAAKGTLVAGVVAADTVVGVAPCIMGTIFEAGAMHNICPPGKNAGWESCMLARDCWQWKTLGLKTGVAPLVFSSADLFGIS